MSSPKTKMITSPDYAHNYAIYRNFWKSRKRRSLAYVNQNKVKRFRKFAKRHGVEFLKDMRVFEQGFGMATMLECFSKTSLLTGLELSVETVDAATSALRKAGFSRLDLRVFESGTSLPTEWTGKADIAISSHVLEHLRNPDAGMSQLASAMRHGGRACVIVPINEKDGQDPNHFSYFTANSIAEIARRSGLKVVEVTECDCLWNIGIPIAHRWQTSGGLGAVAGAKLFHLLFAFWPLWALELADSLLGRLQWPRCQCFMWCEKP